MEFRKYHYQTKEDLFDEANRIGIHLPYSENTDILFEKYTVDGKTLGNRIVIQPLEGCDAGVDSAPSELTKRRYMRFAAGGAGTIWFEATAIVPEGRAQSNQLMITQQNVETYKRLIADIKDSCIKINGHEPVIIQQITHSGRHSRPHGYPEPIIAWNNPFIEKNKPISKDCIITDDKVKSLVEKYEAAAKLSVQAGFDGVDIKACHGYLISEFLGAYERPGEFGGSYQNRTRMLKDVLQAVKGVVPSDFILTTRLSLYDRFPYPWGFGSVKEPGNREPDLSETVCLIKELQELVQLKLLNTSIASPYVNPHISRPFERGAYIPDEHPLEGVNRFITLTKEVQSRYPDITVINTGFSYLRKFAPYVAAGALVEGAGKLAGFGRLAFANPDFPAQLKEKGGISDQKVCVSCSLCTDHLRKGENTGCFVRDREVYKE